MEELISFVPLGFCFVFDNAKIHTSAKLEEILQESNYSCIRNAPYSPEMSPVEYIFHEIKQELKEFGILDSKEQMIKNLQQSIEKRRDYNLCNYYSHCEKLCIKEITKFESQYPNIRLFE